MDGGVLKSRKNSIRKYRMKTRLFCGPFVFVNGTRTEIFWTGIVRMIDVGNVA